MAPGRPALCYLTLSTPSVGGRHLSVETVVSRRQAPGWPIPADGLPPAGPLGCSSTGFVSSVCFHTSSCLTDTPATSHLLPLLSPLSGTLGCEQSCSFLTSGLLWVSVSRSESLLAALRPKGVNSTHYFTVGENASPTGSAHVGHPQRTRARHKDTTVMSQLWIKGLFRAKMALGQIQLDSQYSLAAKPHMGRQTCVGSRQATLSHPRCLGNVCEIGKKYT